MTLVNPAEKITAAPLAGRPATQDEIRALQRFEARIMGELSTIRTSLQQSSHTLQQSSATIKESTGMIRETSNTIKDTIQRVDTLTDSVKETRQSIGNSQPVKKPNCFQQIGRFFVRAFRAIGLIR